MIYYILLKGDTEKDCNYDSNILGEESLGSFYPGQGFVGLHNIINNQPDEVEHITIIRSDGKKRTITEFFDELEKLKIKSA